MPTGVSIKPMEPPQGDRGHKWTAKPQTCYRGDRRGPVVVIAKESRLVEASRRKRLRHLLRRCLNH